MICCCKKTVDLRFSSPNEESCLQVFRNDANVAGASGATCVIKSRAPKATISSYSVFSFRHASAEFLETFVRSYTEHKIANTFKRVEPSKYDDVTALAPYFHLPLDRAAGAIGICSTLLKRAARKSGLMKWPYRKLQSIKKLQKRLKATRDTHTSTTQRRALDERINELQKEIETMCFNIPPCPESM